MVITTKNIKASEQRRRVNKSAACSDILFDQHMTVPASQQQFLSNVHNKSRLIIILKDKFIIENILVKQADYDADVLIVETAINQFNPANINVVVGEDIDLLVLITA